MAREHYRAANNQLNFHTCFQGFIECPFRSALIRIRKSASHDLAWEGNR